MIARVQDVKNLTLLLQLALLLPCRGNQMLQRQVALFVNQHIFLQKGFKSRAIILPALRG
jgi:hypothetical protein